MKILLAFLLLSQVALSAPPQSVESKVVWPAENNPRLVDLARWKDAWWCVFRESPKNGFHKPEGKIRVVTSKDGTTWESASLFAEEGLELTNPRLCVTPRGKLMLTFTLDSDAGMSKLGNPQAKVTFSDDGRRWSDLKSIMEEGEQMNRVTWHGDTAYATSRTGVPPDEEGRIMEWLLTLKQSKDGVAWKPVTQFKVPGMPAEATLRFGPDGECMALVRRMLGDKHGWLGTAKPPYKDWKWESVGRPIGGANFLVTAKGDIVMVAHSDPYATQTALGFLKEKKWEPALALSTSYHSYSGMAEHDGFIWVSYLATSGDIRLEKIQL